MISAGRSAILSAGGPEIAWVRHSMAASRSAGSPCNSQRSISAPSSSMDLPLSMDRFPSTLDYARSGGPGAVLGGPSGVIFGGPRQRQVSEPGAGQVVGQGRSGSGLGSG